MNHHSQVRQFVVNNFLFGEDAPLTDDQSFLETGIVDSTGMLELIMFVETTYQIKIEPEEMVPDNLDSINRVAQFIAKKQAELPAEYDQKTT